MDELYRIHDSFSCPNGGGVVELVDHHHLLLHHHHSSGVENNLVELRRRSDHGGQHEVMGSSEMSDLLKAQIANHPLYPNLVSAYVECRKVGAPPEMASLLEEISKESQPIITPREIGADPELDQFMESYCEALHKYKEELLKPFDEATTFLNNIESQLNNLCRENFVTTTTASSLTSATCHSDEANGSSEEEEDLSCGEVEVAESQESSVGGQAENQLKEMLMRKYSGYLSTLRKEFLKKRKKGKLPKDARMALLEWWNTHYRWPYPTEEEKNKLSELTGLDQKQINNWFINQRKRHWKPSEDMRFALMQGVGAGISGPIFYDAAGGGGGGGGENGSFGT